MGTAGLRHTARPGTDELLVRYRLIARGLHPAPEGTVAVCATTDPEAFFPEAPASGLAQTPTRAERIALAMCDACPLMDGCLVAEMQGVPSIFQVRGVRAGLRQSERRALYLALEREGLR